MIGRVEARLPELDKRIKLLNSQLRDLMSGFNLLRSLIYSDPVMLAFLTFIVGAQSIGSALMPAPPTTYATTSGVPKPPISKPTSQGIEP
jgi:hypothetical protein